MINILCLESKEPGMHHPESFCVHGGFCRIIFTSGFSLFGCFGSCMSKFLILICGYFCLFLKELLHEGALKICMHRQTQHHNSLNFNQWIYVINSDFRWGGGGGFIISPKKYGANTSSYLAKKSGVKINHANTYCSTMRKQRGG